MSLPLEQIPVNRNVFTGQSEETMAQMQGDATLRFESGYVEHALVTGFEVSHETSAPVFGFALGVPPANLLAPNPQEPFSSTGTVQRLIADTTGDSRAVYALDTMKFGDAWQAIFGLRWDRFDVDYSATRFAADGTFTGTESDRARRRRVELSRGRRLQAARGSQRLLGWGTSFNPSAETLSFVTNARALGINNAFLAPEENESIEIGTKWDLANETLTLNAARVPDHEDERARAGPDQPRLQHARRRASRRRRRVHGGGAHRRQLAALGGLHVSRFEGRRSAAGAAPVGSPLASAPENTFTAWAAYTISSRFEVGAGARYVDEQLAQNIPPIKFVEEYWAFDAMGKYHVSDTLTLKLNLTNFTDEYYFDQLHPFHVVPGPGLTAIFAVNVVY